MARDLIYKRDGLYQFQGVIDPYMVQTEAEAESIPPSKNAQAAFILGDGQGAKLKMRLPGGEWTEV